MKIEYKNITQLILDPNNHRFAELYSGSGREEDLVEYLLYTEAAEEVAKNISDRGYFYPDQALWVVPKGKNFLVRDGNRRCAAVKALRNQRKYGLELAKVDIKQLPVLVYRDEKELDRRIQEQHMHSLFREWDPIAKALKAYEMHQSGSSEEVIREIDSNPSRLIKLASFYYEAVKIGEEDLKKLLRRGKGNAGGKTIIFERLFAYSKQCGYQFKGKPAYVIEILDQAQFTSYISALVAYLNAKPKTSHGDVDHEHGDFLKRLSTHGFTPKELPKAEVEQGTTPTSLPTTTPITPGKRGSVKTRPAYERKQVAPKLKRLVNECYNLDNSQFANAKVALVRVTFEAVLKYVVAETKYKNKELASYNNFHSAFYDRHGRRNTYTNFAVLKEKFTELITDTGTKNAFRGFDLEKLHQVVHNYKVGASASDARTQGENLIPLIEFMLQEPNDLLSSLDTNKLS
ncbi:hypothetical protein C4552_02285 [Candidatus Parcubacteria bacterium]|nr:MAG: hypothetical protein C4552_02285 [Candidatus Parcubacteria bacterium]